MKAIYQLLPEDLHAQPECQDIISDYGKSFQEMLQFENSENIPESHAKFNEVLFNIRRRHQVIFDALISLSLSFIQICC